MTVTTLFGKVGGTTLKEIGSSLDVTERVLAPFFVDLDYRVHGTTDVLVTDARVFRCIRVNEQSTTMAMAHYATGCGDPFR